MKLFYALCHKLVGRTDLMSQFRRYRATVLWLYRTLFLFHKGRFLLAVATNIVGVTIRGGVLSLLVVYASRMEMGEDLSWGQYHLATREPGTFLLVVGVLGVLLLLSAVLVFLANQIITRLTVDYAGHSSRQTLAAEGVRPPRNPHVSKDPVPSKVVGRATGLVGIARGIRPLLQVSNPAAMFVYSLAVVLYIDPWMTAVLGLLVAPSLFLQYVINFRAAQNQELLGRARVPAQKAVASLMESVSRAPRLYDSQLQALGQQYDQSRIRELGDRYAFRVMAQPYSTLISDVVLAIAAVILTAYLGLQALSGNLAWSLFLGYLIFARLFMLSLRGVMASITGFARHYPLLRKLHELLSSKPAGASITEESLRLVPRGKASVGDRKAAQMNRGRPVAMVSPIPVSRFNAYAFVDALVGLRSPRNACFRGSCFWVPNALRDLPGGSLSELLGCPAVTDPGLVRAELARLRFEDWDPDGFLDGPLDKRHWLRIPRPLRAHILLSAALRDAADLLLVEAPVLDAADRAFLEDWWNAITERFVAVRYPEAGPAFSHGEKVGLAIACDRSVGLMSADWWGEHAAEVSAWLQAHRGRGGSVSVDEDD